MSFVGILDLANCFLGSGTFENIVERYFYLFKILTELLAFTVRELDRILCNFASVSYIVQILFLIWVDKFVQDKASILGFNLGGLQVLVSK